MKGWKELFLYVAISVGMALSTSVFTMISGLFQVTTGAGAVLGIALGGFFCFIIALSIGELAGMYPSAPGVRTYLKTAFGDRASLLLVYLYLFSVVLVAGLESFIFAQVVRAVFPSLAALPVIVALLGGVAAVNLAGLELPRSVQIVTAVATVACIVISGGVGALSAHISVTTEMMHATPGMLATLPAAAGMALFLYMGFEWVTPLGLRPKSYHWLVPVSMTIAVGVLLIGYDLFVLGMASQMSRDAVSSSPVPQVHYLAAIYGSPGPTLALALAVSATVATFNAGMMGGSRLIYILSREGHLPGWCSWMSLETGSPIGAVILLGSLTLVSGVAVLLWRAEQLVAVIGAAIICVLYAAFLLSALVLRRRRPAAPRPFRSRVWTPLQWLGVAALPFLGVQTLLSEPNLGLFPIYGATLVLAGSAVLVWVYGPGSRETARERTGPPITQSLS